MKANITKVSTLNMTREDWLEARRSTIGGSDASSIVGLNPYESAYSLWGKKTGRLSEAEENEAMRQGTDLEDYVAKRFSEATGKKVRRENFLLKSELYPWAHANVDRMVIGEDAGLECKTTSVLSMKKFKGGSFPDNYYVQCMHYLAVTGCKKWYLAVLVLGKEFLTFEIDRDEDEIKALMESEQAFFSHLQNDTPPDVDGSEATGDAQSEFYPGDSDQSGTDLSPVRNSIIAIGVLKNRRDDLSKEIELHEQEVKEYLGDSVSGSCTGFSVTWKPSSRTTLDSKQLAKEHPELQLDAYQKTTTSRRFIIKEEK